MHRSRQEGTGMNSMLLWVMNLIGLLDAMVLVIMLVLAVLMIIDIIKEIVR